MPEELLDRIDEHATIHGFTGRSEVVREAAKHWLGEFEESHLEDRTLIGVVTVLFDFETTGVEERMMHLCHSHDKLVTSNVHSHVGDTYCLELFRLEGSLPAISEFVGKVQAVRKTLTVEYTVTPINNLEETIGPR